MLAATPPGTNLIQFRTQVIHILSPEFLPGLVTKSSPESLSRKVRGQTALRRTRNGFVPEN